MPIGVHFGPGLQVIHAALHVEDVEGEGVDAEDGAPDEVDVALVAAGVGVAAVAALAEDAEVGADGEVALARHLLGVVVVVLRDVRRAVGRGVVAGDRILAVGPVAVAAEDRGLLAVGRHVRRAQDDARHRHVLLGIEDHALADETAVLDAENHVRIEFGGLGEVAEQLREPREGLRAPLLPVRLRGAAEAEQGLPVLRAFVEVVDHREVAMGHGLSPGAGTRDRGRDRRLAPRE
jgi:hypothetical protein